MPDLPSSPKTVEPCRCTAETFAQCHRAGVQMNRHLFQLCQNYVTYRAKWDGLVLPTPMPTTNAIPTTTQRAFNYISAGARWLMKGKPVVSDTVRAERRAICDACAHLDKVKDACKLCGCPLHATALGDKLLWATEGCPIGKWQATVV
jgi:hypothetical protein